MHNDKAENRHPFKILSSLIMAVFLAAVSSGCVSTGTGHTDNTVIFSSPEECITNENRLFYYYEAVVATQGGDCSTEYILYGYTDTDLVLVKSSRDPDKEKKTDYCIVPSSVLDDCLKLAKKYKLGKGKWVNGYGLVGMEFEISFTKNGELIRVTSANMPDNGEKAFDDIKKVLSKAWSEA